jgi:hypothetical protein
LEQAKTRDPQRLSRLIFVLALFHLIRLGNAVLNVDISPFDPLRRLSLVTCGWINFLVSTILYLAQVSGSLSIQNGVFKPTVEA